MIRVYCAGKIAKNDWRHKLFPGLRQRYEGECPGAIDPADWFAEERQARKPLVRGLMEYAGPFFMSCDHGCWHWDGMHGAVIRGAHYGDEETSRSDVVRRSFAQIRSADAMFAWLDDCTAYGTMTEIGFASALLKPVWLFTPDFGNRETDVTRLAWFPVEAATRHYFAYNAEEAFEGFESEALPFFRVKLLRELPYSEYLQTDHWKALRADALQRAEYRCQVCNGTDVLTVHHRTYERLGEELASDLTTLCRPCHARHHASDRTAARPPKGAGR